MTFQKALSPAPENSGDLDSAVGKPAPIVGESAQNAVNAEMVEGYSDGFDLNNPEPSANRSHSYRHGFAVGRADRNREPAFGSAENARRLAEVAEQKDALA